MARFSLEGTPLEPLAVAGRWIRGLIPRSFRFKYLKLNFIVIHYLYLIGWSIVGSVILFGGGLMPYIDSLFFAAGSSTQSGLNTQDVNTMELYQQIIMYFIACMTNPIFINTFVVFVRLYWFEKRFEHIVTEIREQRKSKAKTMTRSKSEMKEENPDLDRLEHGVNGREIRVLHDTTQPNGMSGTTARSAEDGERFLEKMGLDPHAQSVEPTPEGSNSSSGGGDDVAPDETPRSRSGSGVAPDEMPTSAFSDHHMGLPTRLHRQITFADEASTTGEPLELAKVPEDPDVSKHIEFLQRQQRNAREGSTLRIPGPRDFDRGEVPHAMIHDDDHHALGRAHTSDTIEPVRSEAEREGANTQGTEKLNLDDHPVRAGITFREEEHPGRRNENATFEKAPTEPTTTMDRMKSGFSHLRNRRSHPNMLHMHDAKSTVGRTFTSMTTVRSRETNDPMPYLSWQATTGRNSAFLGLSPEQREELGGIEYRSLKTLAKILLIYFFGFHLAGVIILTPWINLTSRFRSVVTDVSQNPSWWGIFTSASLFNDLGLTLTPDSMISFQEAVLPLLFGSFLIIIGNTGFPVMLRFVIWVASKLVPYGSQTWEELRFLLDHPRRCFTLLFPSKATWWLFWVLVGLNGVDLIFFIILDLNDPTVTSIPVGYRILSGWFQAASTRTAGFACVNLADLHPAIQVSYLIMMYISVFPIAISVRRTNVYEEKSLGVFSGEEVGEDGTDPSYVGQHLRRQLSFDLWYIFLGLFIICIVEGHRLASNTGNEYAFTMFSVLFEIVSAYGTVGLSLGYPGINASLSAEFKVISKLVIVAMMIRGRHRGLPYALDRAILLPSEKLAKKEEDEGLLTRAKTRRGSIFAEGHESDRLHRGATWSQTGDLDEYGLPKQNTLSRNQTMPNSSSGNDTAVASDSSPERTRTIRRRTSGLSTASGNARKHGRSMSLSRVIAAGLSAGPTYGKGHDD